MIQPLNPFRWLSRSFTVIESKVFILALICLVNIPQSLEAKTLADYQREKSLAQQRAQNEKHLTQIEKDRLARLKVERTQRLNEKRDALGSYKTKLEKQGNEKVTDANKTLTELIALKSQIQIISQKYSRSQAPQIQTYRNLVGQFQAYKGQEEEKREELRRNLLEVGLAQTIPAIVPPRRIIRDLYFAEIEAQNKISNLSKTITQDINQAYRDYETEIAPFQSKMDRFTLRRLAPPTPTLNRLNQIVGYSNQRREYFTRIIRARFPDIEQQMTQIITNQVRNDLDEFEKSKIQAGIMSAWNDLANQLFIRKGEVFQNEKNKMPVGCRLKMREFYSFYQEVLSHKDKCSHLENLIAEKSPYRIGCVILKPLIAEAEQFFSETAWQRMNLSLITAKSSAPQALSGLIKKLTELKVHRREGLQRPDLLLKSVAFHDQLLEEWKTEVENSLGNPLDVANEVGNAI